VADKIIEQGAPSGSLGRRLIFWDFARASWQYDLVVGIILIFIFATPRDLLDTVPEAARAQRAQLLIQQRTGKSWHVARVEPIRDEAAQEIKGFIAYTDQAQAH